jgi:hypothetical protein
VTEHSDAPAAAQDDGQQPLEDGGQQPAGYEPPTADWGASSGAGQHPMSSAAAAMERPEVMVAASFAGGLLAALILKRFAR